MRGLYLLMLFLLVVPTVSGAQIHGAIYDKDLNAISKTIVYINSSPVQRHISRYGGYSFVVTPGNYEIVANLTLNNVTRTIAEQAVVITDNAGEYRIDLFMFDHINLTEDFIEDNRFAGPFGYWWAIVGIIIAGLVGLLIYVLVDRHRVLRNVSISASTGAPQVAMLEENDMVAHGDGSDAALKKRILVIVRKEGGQCPQKAIRKQLRLSESKVSMVISELEEHGSLRKVRKGRMNIIRLVDRGS